MNDMIYVWIHGRISIEYWSWSLLDNLKAGAEFANRDRIAKESATHHLAIL